MRQQLLSQLLYTCAGVHVQFLSCVLAVPEVRCHGDLVRQVSGPGAVCCYLAGE